MKLILPNSNRRIRRTNPFGAQLAQKAEFWTNDNGFKRMQWATFGSGTDYIFQTCLDSMKFGLIDAKVNFAEENLAGNWQK